MKKLFLIMILFCVTQSIKCVNDSPKIQNASPCKTTLSNDTLQIYTQLTSMIFNILNHQNFNGNKESQKNLMIRYLDTMLILHKIFVANCPESLITQFVDSQLVIQTQINNIFGKNSFPIDSWFNEMRLQIAKRFEFEPRSFYLNG